MAIYSLNHKTIGRSTHAAGTAGAHLKYIARASACTVVIGAHLPVPTPGRAGRAASWMNEQEAADRKNARVIDKLTLALPRELDRSANLALVRRFAQELTAGQTPWVCGVHDIGDDAANPHAHFVLRDRHHQTAKRFVGMSEKGSTERVRQLWEHCVNEALREAELDARVDHRSLKAQRADKLLQASVCDNPKTADLLRTEAATLDRTPEGHEGAVPTRLEAQNIRSTKLERLRRMREERAAAREATCKDEPAGPGPIEPPTMAEDGRVLRDTFAPDASWKNGGRTPRIYVPEDARTAQLATSRHVRHHGLTLPETPKTRARSAWRDARDALRRGRAAATASAAEAAAMVERFAVMTRRLAWLTTKVPLRSSERWGRKGYLARARVLYAKDYRRAEELWPWARFTDLRGTPDLAATRASSLSAEDTKLVDRWAYLRPPPVFAAWTRRFQDGPRRKSRRLADLLPVDVIVHEASPSDLPAAAPSLRQDLAAARQRSKEAQIAAEHARRCTQSRIRVLRGLSPLHEPSGRVRGLWGSFRSPTPAADLAKGTAILVCAVRHLRRLRAEGAPEAVLHGAEEAYREAARPLHRARLAHVERLGPQERSREFGRLAALAALREGDGLLDPVHAPIRLETLRALVPDPQEAQEDFAKRVATFARVRVRQLVEAGEGLSDEASSAARAEACGIVLGLLDADRPALPRYTRADVEAALEAAAFDVKLAVPPHTGDLGASAHDLEGLREHLASCQAPELVDLRVRVDRAWSEVAGARDAFLADPAAWRDVVAEVREVLRSERDARYSLVSVARLKQRGRSRDIAEPRPRPQEIDPAAEQERRRSLQLQAEEQAEAERHRLRQIEENADRRRASREAERPERDSGRSTDPRSGGSPGSTFEP